MFSSRSVCVGFETFRLKNKTIKNNLSIPKILYLGRTKESRIEIYGRKK